MSESQEPTGPIIPTTAKAEPPFHFSYPVGANAISEKLRDLPEFPDFTLQYSNVTPLTNPNWKIPGMPLLRLKYTDYPTYTPVSTSVRPRRQGGRQWSLEVVAVPRDRREEFQPLILEEGLALLRQWMSGPDAPQPNERRRSVEVWWFDDTGIMKLHDPEAKRRQAEQAEQEGSEAE